MSPPWFIATKRFGPTNGDAWWKYVAWSQLTQLTELVSLDSSVCPTMLPKIEDDFWPHIVNADFLLHFFVDLDFLLKRLTSTADYNLLCVRREPQPTDPSYRGTIVFELLGYELLELETGISALTNCGGFPEAFDNTELSSVGLLTSYDRARQVQAALRTKYPDEPHAQCELWSVSRAISS